MSVGNSWDGFASSTDSGILKEIIQYRLGRNVPPVDVTRFKTSMAKMNWFPSLFPSIRLTGQVPSFLDSWQSALGEPRRKIFRFVADF